MGKEITPIQASDKDSSGKHFKDKPERNLGEEIQNDLTELVDDMKQALDYLFDVVDEDYSDRATGFGYPRKEKLNKIQKARDIYYKHFA